jgi:hypothetical protein
VARRRDDREGRQDQADASPLSEDEIERLAQTRPPASAATDVVAGHRGAQLERPRAVRWRSAVREPAGGQADAEGRARSQPAPYARIEDVPKGAPLRSHTVTGEAHVVNPDLPDGKLRQDQVPGHAAGVVHAAGRGDGHRRRGPGARAPREQGARVAGGAVGDRPAAEVGADGGGGRGAPDDAGRAEDGGDRGRAGGQAVPAEAKRSAAGKTPAAPKRVRSGKASGKAASTRTGARKASPKRK